MQLHVVDILHGDASLLADVVVALRRMLQVEYHRCRHQTERRADGNLVADERLQIETCLPGQRQMFAEFVAHALDGRRLAGQNHGALAAFAQQTAGAEPMPHLPLLLRMAHDGLLFDWFQIVRMAGHRVVAVAERRRDVGQRLRWQRIVLLVAVADEFGFGQVANGRRDELDELLVAVRGGM